jgi:hypothetical protein
VNARANKTSKKSAKVAKKGIAEPVAAKPALLAGGGYLRLDPVAPAGSLARKGHPRFQVSCGAVFPRKMAAEMSVTTSPTGNTSA